MPSFILIFVGPICEIVSVFLVHCIHTVVLHRSGRTYKQALKALYSGKEVFFVPRLQLN